MTGKARVPSRTIDHRLLRRDASTGLFPDLVWDAGWRISLQADAAGYACSPRRRMPCLAEYETCEARLTGPFCEPVDPAFLDLPDPLRAKFMPLDLHGVSLGLHLDKVDLLQLVAAIDRACLNPNAGIPRGVIGWAGRIVYHGTSGDAARDILTHGIDMAASHRGYLGQGFYVSPDHDHARSQYAQMADDAPGAVISAMIADKARILDLRNPADFCVFTSCGIARKIADPDCARHICDHGIDGIYDRSVHGLAIYNPEVLMDLHPVNTVQVSLSP